MLGATYGISLETWVWIELSERNSMFRSSVLAG